MSRLWIKICGITRPEDARAAVAAGADALGTIFYPPSRRAVAPERLPEILDGVPATVKRVALFVDPERELVESVIASGSIDWLQFQGAESADFCRSFSRPYIKALHAREDADLARQASEFAAAELLLLDTYDETAPGGTGKTFDWSLVDRLPEAARKKLVLAGGLSPENVGAAISAVSPFGVDVCSGVERSPGLKDPEKIESFIRGARNG